MHWPLGISFLLMSFEPITAFHGERVCALGDGDRYVGSTGNCADSFLKILQWFIPWLFSRVPSKPKQKLK